ncbi:uncharacterized protein LOC119673470 [Teleopsis dalmanni]|uniref:uncharacterized protein LOC119673470 n=1 Tax=Teleopsis dalmanni TaxID=139649 RepID=UPI0018CF3863|nr:uncharacterized protein LOC119673470 [Teleopsis dalmanni]
MNQLHRRRRQAAEPCSCLRPVIRIFGIITAFAICGVGVDVYYHGYSAGLYILISSIVIFFLEVKWIITLFLHLLFGSDSYTFWLRRWHDCKVIGGWRLAPIYGAIGIALLLWPHNLWLSYVAGVLLIFLAVLRLCTIIRFRSSAKVDGLVPQCDFEQIVSYPDLPEDSFAEVCTNLEDEDPIDDVC